MKKFLSLVLTLVMVMSLSVTAFAAGEQSGTTTLTANIPNAAEPSYTIHIPANTTLEYGNTDLQEIGSVSVSDVTGVAPDNITVISPYTDLINTEDPTDTITLNLYAQAAGGSSYAPKLIEKETGLWGGYYRVIYDYYETPEGFVYENCYEYPVFAEVTDWSGATPGATYQAVITFQFEV